ncbi:42540_t:CDS:1, partial [Gigaspora margarita]
GFPIWDLDLNEHLRTCSLDGTYLQLIPSNKDHFQIPIYKLDF